MKAEALSAIDELGVAETLDEADADWLALGVIEWHDVTDADRLALGVVE